MKKNILITGGGKGIGKGIVSRMASLGHNVIFTYNSSVDSALAFKEELIKLGYSVDCYKIDLKTLGGIPGLLSFFNKRFGEVDVLVNNAALAQEKPFDTITEQDYDQVTSVNLKIPFFLSQKTLQGMIAKKWGRIINIASIGGQWGGINQVHYAVSKAGLINLTRSIAKTYSKHNITCNCISPGLILTDMTEREIQSEAGRKKVESIPAGRLGKVEEVAGAVEFLINDAAAYMTGQTLNLNGGMLFN
jgi:NAD(P)-dependent dehydrogenase (short-subunit alcohol dehydrogenase family)